MRAIYDQLIDGGWQALGALQGEPEGPHLEAKRKSNPSIPNLDEGDKVRIAKTVCGLANADGGCALLGVHAGPDDQGIDKIQGPQPIMNVNSCLLAVQQAIASMIEPPIVLVEVHAVVEPGTDRGVVAVYVAASDGGPHRITTGPEQGRYYMRASSNTVVMPHTILADRFGRRPQPRLRLVADFRAGSGQDQWGISLRLRNEGRGVAHQPAVVVREPMVGLGWRHNSPIDMKQWAIIYGHTNYNLDQCGWQASAGVVVYPGFDLYVTHIGHGNGSGGVTRVPLAGSIYCLDAAPIEFNGVIELGKGELVL